MKYLSILLLAIAVSWVGYATYISGKFQVVHVGDKRAYVINTHTGELQSCTPFPSDNSFWVTRCFVDHMVKHKIREVSKEAG